MSQVVHILGLGSATERIDQAMVKLAEGKVMERIWAHDHTVWKPNPTSQITHRLGWLRTMEDMRAKLPHLQELVEAVRCEGYTHALLLGMGGSSLAPEVFGKTFDKADGYLDLAVLDSTSPGAVKQLGRKLDPSKTLYIVATKSGGTSETLSFFRYFYNQVRQVVGDAHAGKHFVAVTDPETHLVDLAKRYHFRDTLLNDPNIGGRYSALSYFGLIGAALVGLDLPLLLDRAQAMACVGERCRCSLDNPAAQLGVIMGEMAEIGRDKITLLVSSELAAFADWVEQLIAESTGKEGKGILPVAHEALGCAEVYGQDRLFVQICLETDHALDASLARLVEAGHPVVKVTLKDLYDLGGQFFLWEMATAVAGHVLAINPFDQPDVESAKEQARQMTKAYKETGALPKAESKAPQRDVLASFLDQAAPGDYVTFQAYLTPSPKIDSALATLRLYIRDQYHLATTTGYGPRYLHSTGQLHKGDAGKGLFVQLVADPECKAPIPDEAGCDKSSMDFGVLIEAQSLGDRLALLEVKRRVLRLDLGCEPQSTLQSLVASLG